MLTRKICACALSALLAVSVGAQSIDPVILSYQRNFIRSSMSTKIELLTDASRITTVNMTPLYQDALAFASEKYAYLGNDQQLLDIASIAAAKSVAYKDASILPALREVFLKINDSTVRISCLNAIGSLGMGNAAAIDELNAWFGLNATTGSADAKTLSSCAMALGRLGSPTSFAALFSAMTGKVDSSVASASQDALLRLNDGFTDNILAILEKKDVYTMQAAYSLAVRKSELDTKDRGMIAERCFEICADLASSSSPASGELESLIRVTLDTLTDLSWSQASPSVVKYFYFLQQGTTAKTAASIDAIMPVIACMGKLGTTDAAQSLSIYLGLLNSEMEKTKSYNERLMLAVIQALGDLGDKSAFDYLLYVGYLDYAETIKKASRDALARLAW